MTDREIIQGLKCCDDFEWCVQCSLQGVIDCRTVLTGNALDLITRQQAEIERLNEDKSFLKDEFERFRIRVLPIAKAEAIKEFAERLKAKKHICLPPNGYPIDENDWVIYEDDIDNLVKEMVGEDK
jgi:hypothetical protein